MRWERVNGAGYFWACVEVMVDDNMMHVERLGEEAVSDVDVVVVVVVTLHSINSQLADTTHCSEK